MPQYSTTATPHHPMGMQSFPTAGASFTCPHCIVNRASEILLFNSLKETSTAGHCCCCCCCDTPPPPPPHPLLRFLHMATWLSSACRCCWILLLCTLCVHSAEAIAPFPPPLGNRERWKYGFVRGSFASKRLRAGKSTIGATVGLPCAHCEARQGRAGQGGELMNPDLRIYLQHCNTPPPPLSVLFLNGTISHLELRLL